MSNVMQTVKSFRSEIDTMINTLKKGLLTSREVALAYTNCQEAKMWLGLVLKQLGTNNPYPESTNPENKIIEPQADHSDLTYFNQPEWDQTQKVKECRSILDRFLSQYQPIEMALTGGYEYLNHSKKALEKTKLWLGMELDRIRNAEELKIEFSTSGTVKVTQKENNNPTMPATDKVQLNPDNNKG